MKFACVSLFAATLGAVPALAQPTPPPALFPEASAGASNAVTLVRMFMEMPPGSMWAQIKGGIFCATQKTSTYSGGRTVQNTQLFQDPFRNEMQKAGFNAQRPGGEDLFNPNADPTDLEVAAIITDEHLDACAPNALHLETAHGDASMKISWQLYSRIRKQVLAKVDTSGSFTIAETTQGGIQKLVAGAFASNVDELVKNPDFRKAMSSSGPAAGQTLSPEGQTRIALTGNLKAPTLPIPEATGSALVVSVGAGSGSGVLVSDDGYVLTNAHVVSDAKTVRLRWSDGIETVGAVVRTSKERDVALVKTDARGRAPLPLKRGAVSQGQQVFAIGAPLGQQFQGSVSRGVVSANRVIDGMSFIQSDVSIAPGSSGGPLLDDSGHVIGLAVGQFRLGTASLGLNMFIPAGDAMDFLSLDAR
jgi:S1-C subfamily serine protease